MIGSDNFKKGADPVFAPAGVGLAMTRSCAFCSGRSIQGFGWRKYRGLWQCPKCVATREGRAMERAAA